MFLKIRAKLTVAFFFGIFMLIAMLLPTEAKSQSYYYILKYGPDSDYNWATSGSNILSSHVGDQNDILSGRRTIPFSWNFYGNPVTQYVVSDNGYITFDLEETLSYPDNTGLPNQDAPKNTIFGFWDDWEITSYNNVHDRIVSWTYGIAPNRIHVIQWQSVTPNGTNPQSNYAAFAIRLHESGDFDIIHNLCKPGNSRSGTVGAQNATGDNATMTIESPNERFPTDFPVGNEDMAVYEFHWGTQLDYDTGVISLDIPRLVAEGALVNIEGKLTNFGSQAITEFDLNYQIDGGAVETERISGIFLQPTQTYNFVHKTPWTSEGVALFHPVKVWASNLNGNEDENATNDQMSHDIFVNLGVDAGKKVLLEQFSTAPCGWCPRGHLVFEDLKINYPGLIGFTHHSGFLSDNMTIQASLDIADEFAYGAPSGAVDRVLWPGNLTVALSTDEWESALQNRLSEPSPVDIDISSGWDPVNRNLHIKTDLGFVDYPYPLDMNLSVFVIEDSVSGNGDGWDQSNYYNDDVGHPYYGLGDPIPDYVHQHVVRAVLPASWGEKIIASGSIAPGQEYTYEYVYNVPEIYKEEDMSIIASVSYFDDGDFEVLNVEELLDVTSNIVSDVNDPEILRNVNIYPNPARDVARVTFDNISQGEYLFTLRDMVGNVIRKQTIFDNQFTINTIDLMAGIYILELSGSHYYRSKLVVR